jgi:phage terminase small subunit
MPQLDDLRLERFCQHYVATGNALRAALNAGYAASTASGNTTRMLERPEVVGRVAELQEEACAQIGITGEMLKREMAAIAFGGVHEWLIEVDGQLEADFTGATPERLRWLKKVKITERYVPRKDEEPERIVTTELEGWDKLKAIELLGRDLGVFDQRVRHSGPDGEALDLKTLPDELVKALLIHADPEAAAALGDSD